MNFLRMSTRVFIACTDRISLATQKLVALKLSMNREMFGAASPFLFVVFRQNKPNKTRTQTNLVLAPCLMHQFVRTDPREELRLPNGQGADDFIKASNKQEKKKENFQ